MLPVIAFAFAVELVAAYSENPPGDPVVISIADVLSVEWDRLLARVEAALV
jgi:hypothetical protein